MKKVVLSLIDQLKIFVDGTPIRQPAEPINLKQNQLISKIQKALVEHIPIHVIYGKQSFTGDLIKYDKARQSIILKNFAQNMSVIIAIADIDKISLVPKTIRQSQELKSK